MPMPDVLFIFRVFYVLFEQKYRQPVSVCVCVCDGVVLCRRSRGAGVSEFMRIWQDIPVGPGCLGEAGSCPKSLRGQESRVKEMGCHLSGVWQRGHCGKIPFSHSTLLSRVVWGVWVPQQQHQ